MKVTAFIRKTSAKNNTTDQAKIYFRIRDIGGVDIKAVSELAINPNHWSAERQGYKPRVALVPDEKRAALEKSIAELTHLITREYHRGVDGAWLKSLIEEYHHPGINQHFGIGDSELRLANQIRLYIAGQPLSKMTVKLHMTNIRRVERFERFQKEILHRRGYAMLVTGTTADDLREFRQFLIDEPAYFEQYPRFYEGIHKRIVTHPLSENTVTNIMERLRTVFKWCIARGLVRANPFDKYEAQPQIYADPFFLTLEERNRVYGFDYTPFKGHLSIYRDIFMFQCLVGCRVSDLGRLTKANITDGALEYIPQKTMGSRPATVRVPLNDKAKAILARYDDLPGSLLPKFHPTLYVRKIRELLKLAGIDRMVLTINPATRKEEMRPLHEVAGSHTARKTFIGNLYKKVQDPSLIASMSGHSNGSRSFARYRKIDDDMKRDLVKLLD